MRKHSFKGEIIMGKPIVHWELLSKDPAKLSDFYQKVFDWKIQHVPELNYRMVDTGGEGGINGGIMKSPHEEPWPGSMTFYIDVNDLAAYRKRIVAAGGRSSSRSRRCPAWARSRFSWIPRGA
jgi:predicted enzyme related to lactoylglutathione lyase